MRHAPRPLVEDHYHIQELIAAQERRTDDRTRYQERAKQLAERMDDIKAAKAKDTKAFWCKTCRQDFMAESIKEVEADWTNPAQYVAFYRTKCFKGHWCMRLITDTHKDGYFTRSRAVALGRGTYYADTLQPHETGFNLLYKKI